MQDWEGITFFLYCTRAQLKNKKPQHRAHRGTQRYTEVKDEFRKVFQFIPVLSIYQNIEHRSKLA